jgi:hypothetical protein
LLRRRISVATQAGCDFLVSTAQPDSVSAANLRKAGTLRKARTLRTAGIPRRAPYGVDIRCRYFSGLIPVQPARLDGQANTPDLLSPPSVMARSLYYDTVRRMGFTSRSPVCL